MADTIYGHPTCSSSVTLREIEAIGHTTRHDRKEGRKKELLRTTPATATTITTITLYIYLIV